MGREASNGSRAVATQPPKPNRTSEPRSRTHQQPINAMASEGADQKQELKRLGFLYDYAAVATDLSAKYYELVKKQAPTTLSPASRPSREPSSPTAPPSSPRFRTSAQ